MTYQMSPEVIEKDQNGELLLINLHDGELFVLGGVGRFVWQAISKGADPDSVVKDVCRAYSISEARARADIHEFLAELVGLGMLQTRSVS